MYGFAPNLLILEKNTFMIKIYSRKSRWFIPVLLLLSGLNCYAQKMAPPGTYGKFAGRLSFIIHAPVVLPALLQRQQYDTMNNYLVNWKNEDFSNRELIFSLQALLAIQTGKYASFQLPYDCLLYLSDYARELSTMERKGDAFRYYIRLDARYTYDATDDVRKTLLFIKSWAKQLQNTRTISKSELFICRTLSGEITDPELTYEINPALYPDIEHVQELLQDCNNRRFINERDDKKGIIALTTGGWFPTHHLQTLGAHPSIGILLGYRNKWNEYDVAINIRFLGPTPHSYNFVRQDTLYTSSNYDGGYVGFNYTRYLLHKKRTDLGITSGMGYDYFSVVNDFDSQNYDYLNPTTIGSFNWNIGLHFKYFLKPRLYLGCIAKYNLVHYANTGGTNLTGNAFSVDFIIGSH